MPELEDALNEAYVFVRRLPSASTMHRRFEVRSRKNPEAPAMLVSCAQYGEPLSPSVLAEQRQWAARLKSPPSPLLMPLLEAVIEPQHHWITSALPPFVSLYDCLREQHRLSVEDVEWLLQALSQALTAACGARWPRLGLSVHDLHLDLKSHSLALLLPDLPLGQTAASLTGDPYQTMAFRAPSGPPNSPNEPVSSRDYVLPLAQLCTELLGEPISAISGANERFRPLASLSAHQNRVLRSALAGQDRGTFDAVAQFVAEFTGLSVDSLPTVAFNASRGATPPLPGDVEVPAPPPLPPLPPGYTFVADLDSAGPCRTLTATHPAHGEVVVSTVNLQAELAELVRRLPPLLESLRNADPAHLIVPLEVTNDGRFLHVVRRKPALLLLDALRQCRALDKPLAARVLASTHAAYESLWTLVGRRVVAVSLNSFWIPEAGTSAGLPPLNLRLDAAQILLDQEFRPQCVARPLEHYARLAMQLLGHDAGSLSGGHARFSPLAELSASTNDLLRAALDPARTGEIALIDFLARMTASLAGHTAIHELRKRHHLTVPERFAKQDTPSMRRARLMPEQPGQTILALCGESEVRIGRSAAHADLVAQFLPRSTLNDSRTRAVSRVQLRAWMNGGQVMMEDAAGANPCFLEKQRLEKATAVDLPASLILASEYPVTFFSCRPAYPPGHLQVDSWASAPKRTLSARGACLIRPNCSGVLNMELAWVFTDVGIVMEDEVTGARFAASDSPGCLARLHYQSGTYWLEPVAEEVVIGLDGETIAVGEIAPLKPGSVITLGSVRLLVKEYLPEPPPQKDAMA